MTIHRRLGPSLCFAVVLAACGGSTATEIPPPAIVSVTVAPKALSVGVGQSARISATVTGTDDARVTWSVAEGGGASVSSDGTFTAPSGPGVHHVIATSVADPSRSDRCEVTVTASVQVIVTVSPRTAAMRSGETWQFAAAVTGASDTAVTWRVAEAGGGTITPGGVYTAPAAAGIYHVIATSHADATRSDQAVVTVTAVAPPAVVGIAISPRTATVATGGTWQFSAVVTGASDTGVLWSVAEAGGGSVTTGGVYTAPGTAGTYHVVATSRADPTRSDRAAVTVTPTTPPPPAGDVASQLAVLSGRAILFGHQSVGNYILAGVADLLAANAGPEPVRVQDARSASQLGRGIWGDFGVGANAYPAGKIDDFVAVMNGGAGAKVDLAFMKFCFVDFYDSAPYWSSGTVQSLFAKYQAAMTSIRAANPGVTIVHFTVPLVNASFSWTNPRREALSQLIRDAYQGREPVFDIARIESTRPDGSRCLDASGVPLLCAEYSLSGDDGHLNATAKPIVAKALVAFLASLP